jgi:alkylation response protein AidB-like acyl-CoA dehydrogenase
VNFALSDDHLLLKQSAESFVDKEASLAALLRPGATVADTDYAGNWQKVAALGWPGLIVPEEYGGSGLDCLDLTMILGELGRTLMPCPFLGNLLGTWALLKGGTPQQKDRWLPGVASGEARLALAVTNADGSEAGDDDVRVSSASRDVCLLQGTKSFVADAAGADALIALVRAPGTGRRSGYLVDAGSPGVSVEIQPWRDLTRQMCTVRFDGVVAEDLPANGDELWLWVRDRANLALSAESAAGLKHTLARTVEYAKERVAFGRPIGAYQAIKHALSDMLGQSECANAAVLYAAWALAQEDARAPLAVACAKSFTSDAFVDATHRSIQIFGAVGFTWEMENHLYFKRARANAEMFGNPRSQRERVIELASAAA